MPEVQISAFKKLNILHKTLLMGQVLFIAIAVGLVASGTKIASVDKQVDKVLQVAVLIMAAGGFLLGAKFSEKRSNGYATAMLILRKNSNNIPPQTSFNGRCSKRLHCWLSFPFY